MGSTASTEPQCLYKGALFSLVDGGEGGGEETVSYRPMSFDVSDFIKLLLKRSYLTNHIETICD